MNKVWTIIAIISLALSFLFGFFLCYFIGFGRQASIVTDTLVTMRIDTIHDTIPQPTNVSPVIRIDTVIMRDTIPEIRVDTVEKLVYVPIERKEYKTNDYYIVIEGYKPSLLLAETYNKTTFQTRIVKTRPRWGIGLQLGGGTDFRRFSPYIGLGIQYNVFTW